MRLLLAEDDWLLSQSLAKGLREHAYAVDVVGDGESAVLQAVLNDYDAIVLDVLLPKRDGLDVARTLRARGLLQPILMLTARDRVPDKVAGSTPAPTTISPSRSSSTSCWRACARSSAVVRR